MTEGKTNEEIKEVGLYNNVLQGIFRKINITQ